MSVSFLQKSHLSMDISSLLETVIARASARSNPIHQSQIALSSAEGGLLAMTPRLSASSLSILHAGIPIPFFFENRGRFKTGVFQDFPCRPERLFIQGYDNIAISRNCRRRRVEPERNTFFFKRAFGL